MRQADESARREGTGRALSLFLAGLIAGAALPACHASNAAGAAVITSLAGGYSAIRRANGECYVDCLPGSSCNRTTGLCDPLACRGKCAEGLSCEQTETGSACVPRSTMPHMQVVESGARPFGDGQAAQGPAGSIGISSAGAGAGSSTAPTNAVQGLGVKRVNDPPATSGSTAPGLDLMNNAWDRNHADPLPQMSNPNLPPPH